MSLVLLGLTLLQGPPLLGQGHARKPPERPTLPPGRDPNSAGDYYFYGSLLLAADPKKAQAAFYWSHRLDPYLAEPIYGEYLAALLVLPTDLVSDYVLGHPGTESKTEIRHADSLRYEALVRNPFVDRRLENVVLDAWLYRATQGAITLLQLRQGAPRFSAFVSYAYGDYQQAADGYAELMQQNTNDPSLPLARALPFVAMGQNDSAIASVQLALSRFRQGDTARAMRMYESHEYAEYSLGVLFERVHQRDSAAAAYERALLENVAFAPAHWRLAHLRIAAGDTTQALQELSAAVTLDSTDAVSLYEMASITLAAGHADSAVTLLKKAIAYEPYFLQPHFLLGRVYDVSGFKEEAIMQYTSFLRIAPRSMANEIATARRLLTALGGTPPP